MLFLCSWLKTVTHLWRCSDDRILTSKTLTKIDLIELQLEVTLRHEVPDDKKSFFFSFFGCFFFSRGKKTRANRGLKLGLASWYTYIFTLKMKRSDIKWDHYLRFAIYWCDRPCDSICSRRFPLNIIASYINSKTKKSIFKWADELDFKLQNIPL